MTIYTDPENRIDSETNRWLSPTDICHELQIPLQTFYQWRVKGIGPRAYRFGRHLRIDRRDFDEWLQSHVEAGHTFGSPEH
ncbi:MULTISPECIES: helix-turn-helix domain-containing protein [unclassified Arthrobacter]|uniref:helix-turn-helix domain-containing protein n=1 Tax=unclassified Arthrobacter TaxID=235627 RepID=UPI00159D27B9|nr:MULTISPECIES: helix-turn-helix domain-containing protein [unclassified Arthrobacter]MCU6479781.1 helix-turn-helix domain-containing protein [Arthrobacter sp. A2-55]NVM98543.1 helix-turn-helix domain-containing protein [Arthrobacter sp. SDTb3-6]